MHLLRKVGDCWFRSASIRRTIDIHESACHLQINGGSLAELLQDPVDARSVARDKLPSLLLEFLELWATLIFVTARARIFNESAMHRAERFRILQVVEHIAVKRPVCVEPKTVWQWHPL